MFTVATYNVLADAYIRPGYFPRTPATLLEPASRQARLLARIVGLAADVICLQEVEVPRYAALLEPMKEHGYRGAFAQKGRGKPDGCATLVREAACELVSVERVAYEDGTPPSGHVAQIAVLAQDGRRLAVASTHLKWDRPDRAPGAHIGRRQLEQLLRARERVRPAPDGWIVCGDFNIDCQPAFVARLRDQGLSCTHSAPTCNATGPARKIDYLLHTDGLTATPIAPPAIDEDTPLPSEQEPSDHLPLVARFTWS